MFKWNEEVGIYSAVLRTCSDMGVNGFQLGIHKWEFYILSRIKTVIKLISAEGNILVNN